MFYCFNTVHAHLADEALQNTIGKPTSSPKMAQKAKNNIVSVSLMIESCKALQTLKRAALLL